MTSSPATVLSKADARRMLARYHFAATTVDGVFERHGGVQYDPLKPVGTNHDLVLQARVPGYRVDDWTTAAYERRTVYDAWDKQASLVRTDDWPMRRIYHRWLGDRWRERVLEPNPDAVRAVLAELEARGPLTSSQFEHQVHVPEWQGSWYGPRLTKHVLRALWHTGRIVTSRRVSGHHAYDLAERVLPPEVLAAPDVPDDEAVRWLVLCRHRAVGLLRPQASQEVWSLHVGAAERSAAILRLVDEGRLEPVDVEGVRYHAAPEALVALEGEPAGDAAGESLRFVAPLDPLVWDRKAALYLFDFEYLWEVYKPERERRWGYYALPVLHEDRFVARMDAKLTGDTLELKGWWWEEGSPAGADVLEALEAAFRRFLDYLGAGRIRCARRVPKDVRDVARAASRDAGTQAGRRS